MLVFADRKMIRMIKRNIGGPIERRRLAQEHENDFKTVGDAQRQHVIDAGEEQMVEDAAEVEDGGATTDDDVDAIQGAKQRLPRSKVHALREEMQRVTDTTDARANQQYLLGCVQVNQSMRLSSTAARTSASSCFWWCSRNSGRHACTEPHNARWSIHRRATTPTPAVSLAHTIAAPWVCSPSDGWHAQHAITQAAPSAGLEPLTHHARSRMPSSVGERHRRQQNDGLSEAAGVVSLGSMKLATDGPMTGAKFGKHPVSSAYAQGFVIPTTYYDLAG